jgi:hypothetical protein
MNVVALKKAPVAVRSRMDTLVLTPETVATWAHPPFQRPKKINAKVRAVAEALKHNGGVISGVLTLGTIRSGKQVYILDGQHRIAAMEMAGIAECYADVRICDFDNMDEMSAEYVEVNSSLVRMDPDDYLRGSEGRFPALRLIKERSPIVGYGNVRRGTGNGPLLSMSVTLRCWAGSTGAPTSTSVAAMEVARQTSVEEAAYLCQFLHLAAAAWGNDKENFRLWGALNLTMCMWLYRRLVIDRDSLARHVHLTGEQFRRCLMSVSAAHDYVDWLLGRKMAESDRGPCYTRLRSIFTSRLKADGLTPIKMPGGDWITR